jgi:anti-sigma factor RsiW
MRLARRIRDRFDHRFARDRVSEYLDRELSERQRRRLKAHAALCPECGRMLRTLTIVLWELRELGRRPAAVTVAPRVVERLRREPTLPQNGGGPSFS